jgi:hypothetical protein
VAKGQLDAVLSSRGDRAAPEPTRVGYPRTREVRPFPPSFSVLEILLMLTHICQSNIKIWILPNFLGMGPTMVCCWRLGASLLLPLPKSFWVMRANMGKVFEVLSYPYFWIVTHISLYQNMSLTNPLTQN